MASVMETYGNHKKRFFSLDQKFQSETKKKRDVTINDNGQLILLFLSLAFNINNINNHRLLSINK